ncbi:ABC transporter permease subunit [Peptacetobacter hominis]|uniref:ABC transporter permease subunit n=1 Tax=Peptacetobacter hominis TaxID=2743610 RepID=UPI001FE52DAB|nr:ABC transporter permease [Peptacetobacter hominis]
MEKFKNLSIKGNIKAPQIIITIYLLIMLSFMSKINIPLYSLFNDSLVKFGMNFVLVLSLIPMMKCGVGMNFGMAIGIIAGLIGMCFSIELKLTGIVGFSAALMVTALFGCMFGYIYSKVLNRLKGKEDVIGMFCGYSFVFIMNIVWTVFPFKNRVMLYPIGGKGLRPKISLELYFDKILDNFMKINIGKIIIPAGLLIFVAFITAIMIFYFKTKSGKTMEVIAENEKFAELSGVNINRYRTLAIILSTVIAGIGICVYTQSYGFVQLYDVPLNFAFPAVSAILIGGASRKNTTIIQAIVGTYLFQTTYLLSIPIANAILMPELAETLRMIVSNGIILYAFICEGGEKGLWKKKK